MSWGRATTGVLLTSRSSPPLPAALGCCRRAYHDKARGIDAVSVLDVWGLELPGFAGMKLGPTAGPGTGLDVGPASARRSCTSPTGNATLARLLVQRLIPRVVPGRGVADVAVGRAHYTRLDEPGPARLRLNSSSCVGAPDRHRWRAPAGLPGLAVAPLTQLPQASALVAKASHGHGSEPTDSNGSQALSGSSVERIGHRPELASKAPPTHSP